LSSKLDSRFDERGGKERSFSRDGQLPSGLNTIAWLRLGLSGEEGGYVFPPTKGNGHMEKEISQIVWDIERGLAVGTQQKGAGVKGLQFLGKRNIRSTRFTAERRSWRSVFGKEGGKPRGESP